MDRHRVALFVFGLLFVLLAATLLVSERIAEVNAGKLFPAADSVIWGVVLIFLPLGVAFMMYGAYARAWRGWRWLTRFRAIALGGALVFFCLSAADVVAIE